MPAPEWQFAAAVTFITKRGNEQQRRWAFDFAWVEQKVALEVEGGAFTGGRHTRGAGFVKDMSKYNTATLLGWRVLRVTPQQLMKQETVEMIKQLL